MSSDEKCFVSFVISFSSHFLFPIEEQDMQLLLIQEMFPLATLIFFSL
jgi:hypothetical protein